jgi:IS1 family transposase
MDENIRGVVVEEVQLDEAWQFVYCKAKTAARKGLGQEVGDSYLYTAIERNTKLMLTWHFGKRDQWHTDYFCAKVARATSGNFLVSTDGWQPYRSAVIRHLGTRIQHGVIVKIFGNPPQSDQRTYSPAPIIAFKKEQAYNLPKMSRICTSHVERQNLNLRTFVRRMTRLSNGFSKKWANHEAMLALYICHYNYVRVHGTIKTTPAVASGLETRRWTVRDLLEKTSTH